MPRKASQSILDVVSRAAHEAAAGLLYLIDLSKGGLDKSAGCAQSGNNPHPEDGAGTAGNHSDGNTGNVADADAEAVEIQKA